MSSEIVTGIVIAIFGSTGFWAVVQLLIQNRMEKKKAEVEKKTDTRLNDMVLGLGYDRLIHQCHKYLERGYITVDELEDLTKYLYNPYRALGGNGTAELLFNKVSDLPNKEGNKDENT